MPAQLEETSSTPTRPTPSTSANSPHSTSSTPPRRPPPLTRPPYAGPATPPVQLPVRPSTAAPSSTTTADGTMYSGSTPATCPPQHAPRPARASPASDHVSDQPHIPGPVLPRHHRRLPPPPRTPPAPPPPPPAPPGTPAPSPDHQPAPRTPAPRPPVHRARSPVRYIRPPGRTNGYATNRSAVRPGRPKYPRATPAPATYNSPATPGGTGAATLQHIHPHIRDRPPDRHLSGPAACTRTTHAPHRRLRRPVLIDHRPRGYRARHPRPASPPTAPPRPPPATVTLRRTPATSTSNRQCDGVTFNGTPDARRPSSPRPEPRSPAHPPPPRPARDQRPQQARHRQVKRQRRIHRRHRAQHQARTSAPPTAVIHHAPCETTTPLGTPVDPDV